MKTSSLRPFRSVIEIGERRVGQGEPVYVIAEAGANHNRDLGLAKGLVDAAADAGADAVKFQTYKGADLYSKQTPQFRYLQDERSPRDLLDAIALPREWQADLAEHARSRGIAFFSTPFDREAVDGLAALGVPAMKIASFEIVDLRLIRYAAEAGVPVILSTGMATYGEVEDAMSAVESARNEQVALLRCASLYPSPPEIMNLRAMATMRAAFGVPVGLSDHTVGVSIPAAAAALGAELIEKHFTLDRSLEGPDHPFALEPDELRSMVQAVRDVEAALGNGRLEGPTDAESEEMYRLARRSVVAAVNIPAGTVISADMLTAKRPGYGIKPKYIDHLVGRIARVDIAADDVLTWEMV